MGVEMIKRIFALLTALLVAAFFVGCSTPIVPQSSAEVEVIIEQETIIQGGESSMASSKNQNTNDTQSVSGVDTPVSSAESVISSQVSSVVSTPSATEDDTVNIDYEWKTHSEDFKLIAFTFDDGPDNLMQKYVQYFAAFEGSGTFFVNGTKIKSSYEYSLMQNAIDYGWDIGNHGDRHLVATIGGDGGKPATYDQLKADINNLTNKLESNLKSRDGSPYEVALYRPPNIKPTAETFRICDEEKFPVIWLRYDALDWDTTKTDKDRENVFKYGVGTWEDGDIILCHEVQKYADQTYAYIEKYLPEFYRAGYRFCSITELMELRGITREQICGELNNVDGNRGMVTNILDAAKAGKKS